MPRNREPVKPVESESESGEEDEDASEEESDSEPEQTPTQKNSTKPQQTPTPTPKPPPPPPSSSEDEDLGSGSEFETESDSDEPQSNLKQLPSKPVAEPQKSTNGAKNSRSNPNASVPATPTKSVNAKRAAEELSTPKDSKKTKANDPDTSEKKPNIFQRLFTDDDEIVILQGMLDYRFEKKSDPVTDLNAFHEYIKKKLHADFSRAQLQTKIRRLKKKYVNNYGKEKEGKGMLFANSHEQKSYDLSKMLWEITVIENGVEGSPKAGSAARKTPIKKVKVNGTASPSEEVKNVKNAVVVGVNNVAFIGELKKLNANGGASMEENMLKTGSELYVAGQGIEGEDEWLKLRVEELKLYIKQLELRAAQTKLVLDAIKP